MIATVRFLISTVALTIYYALGIVIAAVAGVTPEIGGLFDRVVRRWADLLLRINRLEVISQGLEQLSASQSYVYAVNHTSFVDIWVLLGVLPGTVRFVAKKELLRVPLFGSALKAAGHIAIDRRDREAAFSAYDEAAQAVQAGLSAVIFVEGTRSRCGRIQEFKKGPFVLAIGAQAPVVPVYIADTFRVLPRGSLWFRPRPIRIIIGNPISTRGLGYQDREALRERCRDEMLRLQTHVDAVAATH